MLNLTESFDLLKHFPIAEYSVINSLNDLLKLKFPYYIKIDSPAHKSKIGGVARCSNITEARKEYLSLRKRFPRIKIIMQQAIEGTELIIGGKKDKAFGELVLVGFGGTEVNNNQNISFRALPITRKDAELMIKDLKNHERLKNQNYPIEKLITLIEMTAYFLSKKNIKEIDLNPVIINRNTLKIVDARIKI